MRKQSPISGTYTTCLALFGITAALVPLAAYSGITILRPELGTGAALAFAGLLSIVLVSAGVWLLMRPLKRMAMSAHNALNGVQGQASLRNGFSIQALEQTIQTISRMASLGHEAVKGFRALNVPAAIFDRNGIIISVSAGLRDLLNTELAAARTPKGTQAFTGEHISTLFGELRCDHMFSHQNAPVIIKEDNHVKITATLSQLNENISRKEAGIIALHVEQKNRVGVPLTREEAIIAELKSTCATISHSFAVVSEFMHAIARGQFDARIAMEARGDLGRLVQEANGFAAHLEQLSGILTHRISGAQSVLSQLHVETDEVASASHQMQRSLSVAYNHFTTSTITDQNIAELFSGIHQATHLMEAEARSTHMAVVDAVNTHNKAMKLLNDMADFSTMLEDMGFQLKLLGLNAAVETARVEQNNGNSATLSELCKDIRALGTRFRQTSAEFREWIMPVHDHASMAQHMLAAAQKSLTQIAPAAMQVQEQLHQQEDIVRAAFRPRTEAAQALEQAVAHARAVHETILISSHRIGAVAGEITELYELTTSVLPEQKPQIPVVIKTAEPPSAVQPELPAEQEQNISPDISMDWFKRDILLRELSGEILPENLPASMPQPRLKPRKQSSAA